jgi:hypothetical protein
MTTPRQHPTGHDALDLLDRWWAHDSAGSTPHNTLFAVFGVASAPGRFAYRFTNLPYWAWLTDTAYDHGLALPQRTAHIGARGIRYEGIDPSAAAAAIIAHGLVSRGRRRQPMTEAAHAALLDYYREELALVEAMARFARNSWQSRYCARHLRGCLTVLDHLGIQPSPAERAA